MTSGSPFATLAEALYFESKIPGPSKGITFLEDSDGEERILYADALERARGYAGSLQRWGVEPRERVLVLVPTSSDFLHVFFGLLIAGAIPCPLSPPMSFGDMAEFGERVHRIATHLGARRLVTSDALREVLGDSLGDLEIMLAEIVRADAAANGSRHTPIPVGPDDTAFIQCTSGSTGVPKGVEITHENLVSNIHQMGFRLEVTENDVTVTWLPLYHDMGLIGCLLFSLYWNIEAVFFSPLRFLRQPLTWLKAVSRFRGTMSTAPNFAYSYVTARAKDADLEGIDLSSWRLCLCGAEPIDARTLRRFQERFRGRGLRPDVVAPAYGLAEATLGVTFHLPGRPLISDTVSREGLAAGFVRDAAPGTPDAVEVVSCGTPLNEVRLRILAEDGSTLPDGRVGRIQVHSPSNMRGYYHLPDVTASVLADGWLDTGDLGYLRDGGLRITGRAKDLVIIRGRNYAPSDFEWAAEEVPGVRRGNAVAFGVHDADQGTETLHLVCESDVEAPDAREALVQAVREKVAARTGVLPANVALVPRNSIPKTTSGKLQRRKTRELYLAKQLGV